MRESSRAKMDRDALSFTTLPLRRGAMPLENAPSVKSGAHLQHQNRFQIIRRGISPIQRTRLQQPPPYRVSCASRRYRFAALLLGGSEGKGWQTTSGRLPGRDRSHCVWAITFSPKATRVPKLDERLLFRRK